MVSLFYAIAGSTSLIRQSYLIATFLETVEFPDLIWMM
jgi:hypothetical protein